MFGNVRLIPLLVIVAGLSFSIRVGDFVSGLQNMGAAHAAQEHEDPMMAEDEDGHDMGSVAEDEGQPPEMSPLFSEEESTPVEWHDAGEEEFEYSAARAELFQDLAERRRELDSRAKELMTREALLKAAEQELDQKLSELNAVKGEIEGLLQKQTAEEEARTQSLVKIYEGMKAKDAARIFNTLDMDVLLTVMSRMSERKSAPILAEMDPERARSVTILLAQENRLPSLPSQ